MQEKVNENLKRSFTPVGAEQKKRRTRSGIRSNWHGTFRQQEKRD